MIAWFITSKLSRYTATIGAALLAILTFGASQRRKGRINAERKAKHEDQNRADDVRKRVRDVERVHDDDIRYRD